MNTNISDQYWTLLKSQILVVLRPSHSNSIFEFNLNLMHDCTFSIKLHSYYHYEHISVSTYFNRLKCAFVVFPSMTWRGWSDLLSLMLFTSAPYFGYTNTRWLKIIMTQFREFYIIQVAYARWCTSWHILDHFPSLFSSCDRFTISSSILEMPRSVACSHKSETSTDRNFVLQHNWFRILEEYKVPWLVGVYFTSVSFKYT